MAVVLAASQMDAYRSLGEMLEKAAREGLPTIRWTLCADDAASLVGECDAVDPVRRMRDFEAWMAFLGAVELPGGLRRDGWTHYTASAGTVTVMADLHDEER